MSKGVDAFEYNHTIASMAVSLMVEVLEGLCGVELKKLDIGAMADYLEESLCH